MGGTGDPGKGRKKNAQALQRPLLLWPALAPR